MRAQFGQGVAWTLATLALSVSGVTAGAVEIGKAAPAFSLRQLGGGRASLAAFRGKVVLLSFWTPG
jgi:hypothetical protein